VKTVDVPLEQRNRYSLNQEDVEALARYALVIEKHYGRPMDIEWGKDGTDGLLYILQARPETVKSQQQGKAEMRYKLKGRGTVPAIKTKIMMNVGNPQLAFDFAQLPNEGVGLARLEFIINNNIGVHPKAILDYPNVDQDLKKAVESVARGHASPRAFYVDKVAEGIATIAAAFWPKPVIVRLSDFKSNEYRKLIGR